MAAGACIDPAVFFFEKVPGNAEFALTMTGPAGQFSANVVFVDATTTAETPLPTPPGKKTLPSAKNKTHLVSIIILIVSACDVKVEATVAGQKYCRKISGAAGSTTTVTLLMRMAS